PDPLQRNRALRGGHIVRGRHGAAAPPAHPERRALDLFVLQEDPRHGRVLAAGGDLRQRPLRGRVQPRRLLGVHAATAPGVPPLGLDRPAFRYRAGSAMKTGSFRVVFFWYSAYGGKSATAAAHSRARSASSLTSRTRIGCTTVWSRISTAGCARRLWNQTGS